MSIFLSTNMYLTDRFHEIGDYIRKFEGKIGVEVFSIFNDPGFEAELKKLLPLLQTVPVSFHGPYYKADHAAPEGTELYRHTMELTKKSLEYEISLHSRHFVFHHNNMPVTTDTAEDMKRISRGNYRRVEALHKPLGIPVVVENVGVRIRENVLFQQEEFTRLCREEHYPVLIDIGHAWANGWDLERLMFDLKDQIVAYHLHNNDGIHDSHQRIHHGTLPFGDYLKAWRKNGRMTDWVLEYVADVADDREGITEDLEELLREYHL